MLEVKKTAYKIILIGGGMSVLTDNIKNDSCQILIKAYKIRDEDHEKILHR